MTWQIQIPFRERSDSLSDVAEAARELPTDESRVVRRLVLDTILGGQATTAGELLDKLEKASPEQRRKMLDRAREGAGLKSATRIEFEREHAQNQRNAMARSAGSPPPRLAYSESGAIVDLAEQEQERERWEARMGCARSASWTCSRSRPRPRR